MDKPKFTVKSSQFIIQEREAKLSMEKTEGEIIKKAKAEGKKVTIIGDEILIEDNR